MMIDLLITNVTFVGFIHTIPIKQKNGTSYTVRSFLIFNLQISISNMKKHEDEKGGTCRRTERRSALHYFMFMDPCNII